MKKLKIILLFLALLALGNTTTLFGQEEVTKIIQNAPITSNGQVAAILVTYEPHINQDSVGTFYTYNADRLTTGFYGSTLITDAEAELGSWYCVQVLEDCVIDSLIDVGRDGNSINGVALNAGTTIFGKNITKIQLISGKVMAYKKRN